MGAGMNSGGGTNTGVGGPSTTTAPPAKAGGAPLMRSAASVALMIPRQRRGSGRIVIMV